MSGPSLHKKDAHSSIHEAALNEAKELRDLLLRCLKKGDKEKALQISEVIIEHWEMRTLKHAESEEEGLYQDIIAKKTQLNTLITQLTRDHDLMRRIVGKMKELLLTGEVDEQMIKYIDGLIIVDVLHNEDEMEELLSDDINDFTEAAG
ncbi:hemerythrin domain-containing protein [Anaerobacillus sp. MEB173]|uniref:hemerythrin domain-containing protein n=1 Tax=Anaerobacillus sp. MEB173 TaxID=3383345 RepID=UPI003F8E617B